MVLLCGLESTAALIGFSFLKIGEPALDGLIGNTTHSAARSGLRLLSERLLDGGRLPANHDLARGFRRAALRAMMSLVQDGELDRLPGCARNAIDAFGDEARSWVKGQQANLGGFELGQTSAADIVSVIRAAVASDSSKPEASLRAAAEHAMLTELHAAVGVALPDGFEARFKGEVGGQVGWFDASLTFLAEDLKRPGPFRDITILTLQALIQATVEAIGHALDDVITRFEHLESRLRGDRPDALATKADITRLAEEVRALGARQGSQPAITEAQIEACVLDAVSRGIGRADAPVLIDEWATDKSQVEERVQWLVETYSWPETLKARLTDALVKGDGRQLAASLREAEGLVELARLREVAQVRAAQGDALRLSFDFRGAAQRYTEAADMLSGTAAGNSWRYRFACADALLQDGRLVGSLRSLKDAVRVAGRELVPFAAHEVLASAHDLHGVALAALAAKLGSDKGARYASAAVFAHQKALDAAPQCGWLRASIKHNMGGALIMQAATSDALVDKLRLLEQAVNAFQCALTIRTREAAPLDYALSKMGLGVALLRLGEAEIAAQSDEEA